MVFLELFAARPGEPSSFDSVSLAVLMETFLAALFQGGQRWLAAVLIGALIAIVEKWVFHLPVFLGRREILYCLVVTSMILGIPASLAIAVWFLLLSFLLRAAGQFGEGIGWMAPAHRWFAATIAHFSFWRFYVPLLDHPLTVSWPVTG
jgi:hypothetical protein